jgi:hypothetical protein
MALYAESSSQILGLPSFFKSQRNICASMLENEAGQTM